MFGGVHDVSAPGVACMGINGEDAAVWSNQFGSAAAEYVRSALGLFMMQPTVTTALRVELLRLARNTEPAAQCVAPNTLTVTSPGSNATFSVQL